MQVQEDIVREPDGSIQKGYIIDGYFQSINDNPAVIQYYPNGQIKAKLWLDKNIPDRKGDNPAEITYHLNGKIMREAYKQNDIIMRETDNPSIIEYDENGNRITEVYFKNGLIDRKDEPALIKYSPEGKKILEKYYENNKVLTNNDNVPSYISYDNTGKTEYYFKGETVTKEVRYDTYGVKQYERWLNGNVIHRENDLPATIQWYPDFITYEWYINGEKMRLGDKPNYVETYYDGSVKSEKWNNREGDLPLWIGYAKDGSKEFEVWYINKKMDRKDDKPSYIFYYPNQQIKGEGWTKEGLAHREGDLPQFINYYQSGNISKKEWKQNDIFYRTNLPALIEYFDYPGEKIKSISIFKDGKVEKIISYYENGNLKSEKKYIDGKLSTEDHSPSIIEYNPEGIMVYQANHQDGFINTVKSFNNFGQISIEEKAKNGVLMSKKVYDNSGNFIEIDSQLKLDDYLRDLINSYTEGKDAINMYKRYLYDLTDVSNISILILNTVCYGFGDIIFSYKLYKILKGLYPKINIKIGSTKSDSFKQLGVPDEILIKINSKNVKDQCLKFSEMSFQTEQPVYDLIFVAPLYRDLTIDYNDVKNLIPYSNILNTFFFSEYNDDISKKFDFHTGVGDYNLGLMFTNDNKDYIKLPNLSNSYSVAYIADTTGWEDCFKNFIEMISMKYSYLNNFDVVISPYIGNYLLKDLEYKQDLIRKIISYFSIINLITKDNQYTLYQIPSYTPKILTLRADILPLPYEKMKDLFFYSVSDVLATGDQSITDVLDCCWKDKLPFYQIVPWKKDFSQNLALYLPQVFLNDVSTSCGSVKAINYKPDFTQFMNTWVFSKMAKPTLDSILAFTIDSRLPNFKDIKNIVLKNEDVLNNLQYLMKELELQKIDINETQYKEKLCQNDSLLFIWLDNNKTYKIECVKRDWLRDINNRYNYCNKKEGLIQLSDNIYLPEKDVDNILSTKYEIAYLIKEQTNDLVQLKQREAKNCIDITNFNLYSIKVCGGSECLKKIF